MEWLLLPYHAARFLMREHAPAALFGPALQRIVGIIACVLTYAGLGLLAAASVPQASRLTERPPTRRP